jgi:hypothetical protein
MVAKEVKRKTVNLFMAYGDLLEAIPEIVTRPVKDEVPIEKKELFWGAALIGSAVVLSFAPKLLLVYLPLIFFANRLAKESKKNINGS